MNKLLQCGFILLALAIPAGAQTSIGYGASVNRSSAYDPTPAATGDGGKIFAGAYVEANLRLPANLNAHLLAEFLGEPVLPSIFTSDADTGRRATSQINLRPKLQLDFPPIRGSVRIFAASGVDYFRQRFEATRRGGSVSGWPVAGLNPFASIGARIGRYQEASYSYLFTDTTGLNNSRLSGHRANYSYRTRRILGPFALKIAAEVDYLYFRDSTAGYVAHYYKRDAAFKVRVGLLYY